MNKYALDLIITRCRASANYRALVACNSEERIAPLFGKLISKLEDGELFSWLSKVVHFPNGSTITFNNPNIIVGNGVEYIWMEDV
jgi:hypothetical protein